MEELPVMYGLPKEACSWIERMLKYTVDGGKMNRGLSLVTACKAFTKSKGHQEEIDSKVSMSIVTSLVSVVACPHWTHVTSLSLSLSLCMCMSVCISVCVCGIFIFIRSDVR